ncbi:MAG: MarR family transcriptional regulator [Pseudomonadota bacterium]
MTQSAADALCQFIPPFMRYLREGLAEVDMSPARFQIMQALHQQQALSMVDLATRLSVTKRNITSLVDGLEKDGLAARHPHPTDRRSTLVMLTPAGTLAFSGAADVQRDHLTSLLGNLDVTQQKELALTLRHLIDAMKVKIGSD